MCGQPQHAAPAPASLISRRRRTVAVAGVEYQMVGQPLNQRTAAGEIVSTADIGSPPGGSCEPARRAAGDVPREQSEVVRQACTTVTDLNPLRPAVSLVPWNRDDSHNPRAGHPVWRRGSSLTYAQ
jgi:hypothetical protein